MTVFRKWSHFTLENQTRNSNSSRFIAIHVQFINPMHSIWTLHGVSSFHRCFFFFFFPAFAWAWWMARIDGVLSVFRVVFSVKSYLFFILFSYSSWVLQHLQPLVCVYHFSTHLQSIYASPAGPLAISNKRRGLSGNDTQRLIHNTC